MVECQQACGRWKRRTRPTHFFSIRAAHLPLHSFATPALDGHWGAWDTPVETTTDPEALARYGPPGKAGRERERGESGGPGGVFTPPAATPPLSLSPSPSLKSKTGPPRHPPARIASAFYPAAGLYSSRNATAVAAHMGQMDGAGVEGVLLECRSPEAAAAAAAWGGGAPATPPPVHAPPAVAVALAAAADAGLRVGFFIEPHAGRSARTVRADLAFCLGQAARVGAGRRQGGDGGPQTAPVPPPPRPLRLIRHRARPLVVVRGSSALPASAWGALLSSGGALTIRGTPADAAVLGEWASAEDGADHIAASGFDGAVSPPADDEPDDWRVAAWGAAPEHWAWAAEVLANAGLLFLPTVSPGADPTPLRPWEEAGVRDRQDGARYVRAWRAGGGAGGDGVLVDSWNGWVGGTQVEAAAGGWGGGGGGGGGGPPSGCEDSGGGSAPARPAPGAAVPPGCAPAVRSYERSHGRTPGVADHMPPGVWEADGGSAAGAYIAATAAEAARVRAAAAAGGGGGGRLHGLPLALASQVEARRAWMGGPGAAGADVTP